MPLVKIPIPDQWQNSLDLNADGFVLKAYEYKTTTPKTIYYNNSLSNPLETAIMNANGSFEVSGNEVTLYTDDNLRAAIYRNSSDAAADSNPFYGPIDISLNTDSLADANITGLVDKYDEFDDRYLGAKAADPTLDNDGDPLLTGANYYNTVGNDVRVYNGSSWDQIQPLVGLSPTVVGYRLQNYYDPGYTFVPPGVVPRDTAWSSNGSKLFVLSSTVIYEYPVSRAYDLRTVGTLTNSYDLTAVNLNIDSFGLDFNADGTRTYVCADLGGSNGRVFQFDLSVGFDLSTISYSNDLLVLSSGNIPDPVAFTMALDGSFILVINGPTATVWQYNLSVDYDITTGVIGDDLDVSSEDSQPRGVVTDGISSMFILGSSNKRIYQYLTTVPTVSYPPFDLGVIGDTEFVRSVPLDAATGLTTITGLTAGDNGSRMYWTGSPSDTIYQLSTNILRV